MDEQKVEKLIAAFRIEATVREACAYAEITARQYKYFLRKNPSFREVPAVLKLAILLKARTTVHQAIEMGDPDLAMRYLEWRLPEEFGL